MVPVGTGTETLRCSQIFASFMTLFLPLDSEQSKKDPGLGDKLNADPFSAQFTLLMLERRNNICGKVHAISKPAQEPYVPTYFRYRKVP